jgi:hypothetical protein
MAVALAVLAAVVFMLTADLGRFRDTITDVVSTAAGREFRVAGALSIKLGRTIDIYAEGVTLADAPWSGEEPMLRADSIRLSVSTASVFSGPLTILDAELRDAAVRIATDNAGRSNWDLTGGEDTERDQARGLSPPALLERMHVEDLAIEIVHPALLEPIEIVVETAQHDVVDDRVLSRLVGSLNGEPLEFENDLGPRTDFWRSRPVDFVLHGRLGEVALRARGQVDDLLSLERPVVTARAEGPSVEYVLDLLNLPLFSSGPLALDVHFEPLPERVAIRVDGIVGEFTVGVDGWVSAFSTPDSLDLSFRALGPDISHVGRLLGTSRLPVSPFELSGNLARDLGALRLEGIELRVGDTLLTLAGVVHTLLPPTGNKLVLDIRGEDIAEYRTLLGLPGQLEGPFHLRARILQPENDIERLRLSGNVGAVTHSMTVYFDDSPDLSGERVEFLIEGPDAGTVGRALAYDDLPALPFRVEGSARYTGERIDIPTATLTLGRDELRISGTVRPELPAPAADLDVSMAIADIGATLSAWDYEGVAAVPADSRMRLQLDGRMLNVTDLVATIGDIDLSGSLSTDLEALTSSTSMQLRLSSEDPMALFGETKTSVLASLPLEANIRARTADDRIRVDMLEVEWGDAWLKAHGVIGRPPEVQGTQFQIRAASPSLASLAGGTDYALPDVPFALEGSLEGTREAITGSDMRIELGDIRATLDVAYRPSGAPTIDLQLESPYVDLRLLLPEREPAPAVTQPDPKPAQDRLFPDATIPVERLQGLSLHASLRVDEWVAASGRFRDIRLDGTVVDGGLVIEQFGALGARGEVSGRLSYTPVDGDYRFEAEVDGKRFLFAAPESTPEQIEAAPRFDIEARLGSVGMTVHGLLHTLDGHLIISGSPGVVPTDSGWLMNMITGDFVYQVLNTINPLAKEQNTMRMDCTVVLVDADKGRLTGDPLLVMQTDRLNLFVTGKIDLATEALDVSLNTQQRKGLGLSIGEMLHPYTKITGTLAAPRLVVDPKGTLVEGGAAAITGGLTLIAKGLKGRFFSDRKPCEAALEAYRESLEQAEQARQPKEAGQ